MSAPSRESRPRVLVLKLGALGNIILARDAFATIRAHHADAEITLLTMPAFAGWLGHAPWFDRILIDPRAPWWRLGAQARLIRTLRAAGFARVYDLQTSGRSGRYRLFFTGRQPEWSGIAPGASHPDRDPARNLLHDMDRLEGQLRQAGLAPVAGDFDWCRAATGRFGLPARYALLVPGASAHRPEKRWPVAHFRALATALLAEGIAPVMIGTAVEAEATRAIAANMQGAFDLAGRTSLDELASLGRAAALAIGNDTGPMHLLAAVGCPALTLFSAASDPALCAPRGARVAVRRAPALADLPAGAVIEAARDLARGSASG
ncbi:MAG: glycosyltransferase family 9 protein [Rhodospirillales bacterium]|nr:glycosyltransferase family 9 protein [Rhodospirillales bacterium]